MKTHSIAIVLASALAATILVAGCTPAVGGVPTPAYQSYLYMTDTNSGKIYAYDPTTHIGSSLSLLTTSNGAGEIKFYKGIGYVAIGTGGIWYFDPSRSNPAPKLITGSAALNAQYFAFFSPTKAYLSTADFFSPGSPAAGLYTFNPSNPDSAVSAVISGTSTKNFQEVIVGSDGYIYATNNTDHSVLRIDPSDDSIKATVTTTSGGTTGLVAGTLNGISGVFVANTGGYDTNWNPLPGSIDFIANTVSTATALTTASIHPGRVAQLSNGKLIATGFGNSYLVDLASSPATVTEIKNGSTSFGSLDIGYKDGLIYVPDYYSTMSNKVFIFDESGTQKSYSPVPVMSSSDAISNIGFYE